MINLPTRPALRTDLYAQPVAQGVVVVGDGVREIFLGQSFAEVVPLLDGSRSEEALVTELAERVSPAECFWVIEALRDAGLLSAKTAPPQPSVCVQSIGAADRSVLLESMASVGLEPAPHATATLRIAVTEHYLEPAFRAINADGLRTRDPWLPLKLVGRRIWIGPLIQPGVTACWECLAYRIRLNSQVEDFVCRATGMSPGQRQWASTDTTRRLSASLATMEIAGVSADPSRLAGRILTFDWLTRTTAWHVVTRRPQCAACGNIDIDRASRRIPIDRLPKFGDSHRSVSSEETVARYAHLVSPISGVVSWLAPHDDNIHGVSYSVTAGHNFVMGPETTAWLRRSVQTATGGKGGSSTDAKAGAIGEAVERYSGVARGEEPTVRGSLRSLSDTAIDPMRLMHFSERQYAGREHSNANAQSAYHIVPHRFDPDAQLDWTPVWSMTKLHFALVPSSWCYFGHVDSAKHFYFSGDSSGCAAGNSIGEAFLGGFYELVERDAVALWWYNRARRPAVAIESFSIPNWPRLKQYYTSLGRDIWAIDITTDLGIPAIAAFSAARGHSAEDIIFGFGAHLDPRAALQAALSELNQFLPAVSGRLPEGTTAYHWPEQEAVNWWMTATISSEPYVTPDPSALAKRFTDYPAIVSRDIGADIEECVRHARKCDLDVFALDLTRSDVGMPVCRAIVPGLRHFWRRLGPGRLYDVPPAIGWTTRVLDESEMNPYSIFF